MSLHHPDTVKMSKVKFKSILNWDRIHSKNCNGHFKEDKNYKGTAMKKVYCTTCGAVGFSVRETKYGFSFEGYLPQSFLGSLKLHDESQLRVFSCRECGETLDQPVNNSKVVCPVCGEHQFKPNVGFTQDKPSMYNRARIS